jgi:hypothetical protein
MAVIISYPVSSNVLETDLLLGTHIPPVIDGEPASTKNFTVGSIVSLAQAGMPSSQDLQSVLDNGNEVISQNNDNVKIVFINTDTYDDEGTPVVDTYESNYGANVILKYNTNQYSTQRTNTIDGRQINLEQSDDTNVIRSTYITTGFIEILSGESGLYLSTSAEGNINGNYEMGSIHFISTLNGALNSKTILRENPESTGGGSGDYLVLNLPIHNFGSQTKTIATLDDIVDSRPYKVYTAVISQFGTDAPVSIVSENTLGFNLTWARLNEGLLQYKLSAPNPTDINSDKAWVSIGYGSNGGGVPVFLTYTGIFDSVFSFNPFLLNGTRADLQTNGRVPIEIRVYN